MWPGSKTEGGLTGHELVGPVPLLLIVMQCPQIDDNICALVDSKLANAVPKREKKEESKILSFPNCSAPSFHSPPAWGKKPYTSLCPLPHLFPSFFQIRYESSPSLALFLTSSYVLILVYVDIYVCQRMWVCILSWCMCVHLLWLLD